VTVLKARIKVGKMQWEEEGPMYDYGLSAENRIN
jgi:hypothetical protein